MPYVYSKFYNALKTQLLQDKFEYLHKALHRIHLQIFVIKLYVVRCLIFQIYEAKHFHKVLKLLYPPILVFVLQLPMANLARLNLNSWIDINQLQSQLTFHLGQIKLNRAYLVVQQTSSYTQN
ncbi:hypothetical protein D3C79_762730 [compost metagenome]